MQNKTRLIIRAGVVAILLLFLGLYLTPNTRPHLLAPLLRHGPPSTRLWALKQLSADRPNAFPFLLEALADPSQDLRGEAYTKLRAQGATILPAPYQSR